MVYSSTQLVALVLCAAGGDLTAEDVMQGIADRETALSAYSMTFDFELSLPASRDFTAAGAEGGKLVTCHKTIKFLRDSAGRERFQSAGEGVYYTAAGPEIQKAKAVIVFDGTTVRSMKGKDEYGNARITSPEAGMGWCVDPRELVSHFAGSPVSELLKHFGCHVIGEGEQHGRTVVIIETDVTRTDKSDWKTRFLVDAARGFAVVKGTGLIRFHGVDGWHAYGTTETFEHQEVQSGLWLPRRVKFEHSNFTEDGIRNNRPPAAVKRWTATVREWDLEPEVDNSMFTLSFPPGVFVNDKVTGRAYQAAAITDQMLADQAARAAPQPGEGGSEINWWLIAALGLVPVAAVVGWLLWRRSGAA